MDSPTRQLISPPDKPLLHQKADFSTARQRIPLADSGFQHRTVDSFTRQWIPPLDKRAPHKAIDPGQSRDATPTRPAAQTRHGPTTPPSRRPRVRNTPVPPRVVIPRYGTPTIQKNQKTLGKRTSEKLKSRVAERERSARAPLTLWASRARSVRQSSTTRESPPATCPGNARPQEPRRPTPPRGDGRRRSQTDDFFAGLELNHCHGRRLAAAWPHCTLLHRR